jgi:DNA repair photolyase
MNEKTVFIPYSPKQVVNKHKHPDCWFWVRYTVHPYIGCQHGCEFCYCRESKFAPYADIADFPHVIKVKENAPDLLRRALAKAPKDTVFMGDYQPAEKKFMLSRKMLEVCLELDFPVFILERSPLVLRDLDLLQEINRKTHATVAFSVIHTNRSPHAADISRLENLAPAPEKRFEAMQTLSKAGIRTGICFMPILPGLCDTQENLELVIKTTAENGGRFVLASTLTLADQQKTYFLEVLRSGFPEIYDRYRSLYPPDSYGPAGDTWLKVGRQIREICRQVGIPDRQPRPLIPGEKRALNKRTAEFLADKTYSMELESEPASRIWPYRKAAWAVEELEQDLGLVYQKMGLAGLKSINSIGESIGSQIESFIKSCKSQHNEN